MIRNNGSNNRSNRRVSGRASDKVNDGMRKSFKPAVSQADFDVIGFGALNWDELYQVERIVGPGQETFVKGLTETPGGSAANTAVGSSRLGLKAGFIGKVARDREGDILIRDFLCEGVNTDGIVTVAGRSGRVMGFVDENGQRALYVNPGVNDTLTIEEINKGYAVKTKFLHLTSFVGEEPFKAQKELIKLLPEDVKISFDPGEIYARKGLKALEPILERSYIVMLSNEELRMLTQLTDYKKSANVLLALGAKIVAVKCGAKGSYIETENESHRLISCKVPVKDTTGAGDAFNAGFLYGLLRNKTLPGCGQIGNFVASRCIMQMGARAGLPYLRDIHRQFQ